MIAASSITVTLSPTRRAILETAWANRAGVSDPPGSFTRSRAHATASAIASPRSIAVRTAPAVDPTIVSLATVSGSGLDR